MSNNPYQPPSSTRSNRQWWGFGSDAGGCIGCGPAWWAIAAAIAIIVLFWGWGWPGYGGWAGWGWRSNTANCPPHTTGYTQPAPSNEKPPPNQSPSNQPNQNKDHNTPAPHQP